MNSRPAFATILQLIKRPSRGDGTEFCNLYNVYEALPEDLKERVRGHNGIHHLSKLRNPRVTISTTGPEPGSILRGSTKTSLAQLTRCCARVE